MDIAPSAGLPWSPENIQAKLTEEIPLNLKQTTAYQVLELLLNDKKLSQEQ